MKLPMMSADKSSVRLKWAIWTETSEGQNHQLQLTEEKKAVVRETLQRQMTNKKTLLRIKHQSPWFCLFGFGSGIIGIRNNSNNSDNKN